MQRRSVSAVGCLNRFEKGAATDRRYSRNRIYEMGFRRWN